MAISIEEDIRQSLEALKNDPALSTKDFANLVRAFSFHPDQGRFLLQTNAHNEKLAETLIVFRKKIAESINQGLDLTPVIDQLWLHYIINTDGPIPEIEGIDAFDVFDAATRYAGHLCVAVSKDANGNSILHIDDKEVLCLQWGVEPGVSAARMLRSIGPVINRARYGRDDVIPSYAFGFDENEPGHTLENAMTLADFSHLAYFTPAYVEKQLKAWGYDSFKWIENSESDTQAFLAAKGDCLVLCFRGTSSGKDVLADLNFFKTAAFGGIGKVHRGFQRALDSVWDPIKTAIDSMGKEKKLFICGHSLGAALAQLAAHRLSFCGYPIAHVYVFGSPRVANRDFMEQYNELLSDKTFLHINHKDIVTSVPLALLGFHHLGGPPRSFDNGHVITDITETLLTTDELLEDTEFEKLDVRTQEDIQQQMYEVEQSIRASTRFLTTDPNHFSMGSYDTQFNSGAADEHCMDQYLFKFACAMVDRSWGEIGKAAGSPVHES